LPLTVIEIKRKNDIAVSILHLCVEFEKITVAE